MQKQQKFNTKSPIIFNEVEYGKYLYENYSEEIFNGMNRDKQATPDESDLIFDASWEDMRKEFNYYINCCLFNCFKKCECFV